MTKLHPTRNDLPEQVRAKLVDLLNASLADSIDLGMQAKQAHWNVKGPHFLQLHELFDQVYSEVTGWSDMLAERAAQLGGMARGSLAEVSGATSLPAIEPSLNAGHSLLKAISRSLADFGAAVRSSIRKAEEAGDAGTADLYTEISRGSDKLLWFVESHLASAQR